MILKIIDTVVEAYHQIDIATTDRESDVIQVFGTPDKPNWAPESHIYSGGQIIYIRPWDEGIMFYSNDWVNCFGIGIYCVLRRKAGKVIAVWHKRFSDESAVTNIYINSVIEFLLKDFNLENIISNIEHLKSQRVLKEFGLSADSYCEKKQSLKNL